mmetsp:Transcript_29054/g.66523  ORF Transcript_29054/g.66523 Transcript_29054/m.66523 type:complete len:218 (-) Transcript_29054:624-1277(-)
MTLYVWTNHASPIGRCQGFHLRKKSLCTGPIRRPGPGIENFVIAAGHGNGYFPVLVGRGERVISIRIILRSVVLVKIDPLTLSKDTTRTELSPFPPFPERYHPIEQVLRPLRCLDRFHYTIVFALCNKIQHGIIACKVWPDAPVPNVPLLHRLQYGHGRVHQTPNLDSGVGTTIPLHSQIHHPRRTFGISIYHHAVRTKRRGRVSERDVSMSRPQTF